jgi:LacI family transcriptional regulator
MTERTKFTMRDVARLSGVSTSTVSAVINGTVPVSSERKKRVLEAMAALDFQPDAIARSLKTGKTNIVGVVIPDITNAFYPEVVRGVEETAQLSGYSVLLCDSREDPETEKTQLTTLFSQRVDGVLLSCCANSTVHDIVIRRRFPIVFVDRLPPAASEGTVCTDNVRAGHIAARHLLDLGHERIAMVAGNLDLSPHRDRLEGFRKAMQECHIPIRDEYLICGDVQIENGLVAGHRLMALKTPPTAIMVSNNKLSLGVLQAIDEKKLVVPGQLSIIGFDDYIWNKYFSPSLTSIAQSTHEMGKRSFQLLLQIMNRRPGEELPEKHIRLAAELRVRNSTAPPPQSLAATAVDSAHDVSPRYGL